MEILELKQNDQVVGKMTIQNQTEQKAELYFYGDIVSSLWDKWACDDVCPQDVSDFLKQLDGSRNIDVYINSGGGSVFAGIAIYNQLKRHDGFITVHVDGLAASIASVIAMAGDRIIVPKSAQLMIHKPWGYTMGNADDFLKMAEALENCQKSITAIYMEKVRKNVTEEEMTEKINDETWMTGEKAAEIFEIEVEEQGEIAACTSQYFGRYNHLPEIFKNKPPKAPGVPAENHKALALLKAKLAIASA